MYGESVMPSLKEIHTITLKFGEKCNFNCRHCCQAESQGQVKENLALNEDVIRYIGEKAERYFAKTSSKLRLRLWGGEPLIYMENIKEIVNATKKHPVKYFFTTNGSLLTEEIVEYANQEDIRISLSNDGAATGSVRRVNVLEDENIARLFNKIASRSVTLVLSPYSQDLFAAWEYIHAKTGTDTFINVEFLMANETMPEDLTAFNAPAFDETMRKVVDAAQAELASGKTGTAAFEFLRIFTINAILVLQGKIHDSRMLECRQIYETVNLDLQGNIYPCHNFGGKLGDIYLPHTELIARYNQTHRAVEIPPECQQCEAFPFCRGHCPFIRASEAKSKCCEIRRIFFRHIASFINKQQERSALKC
jgi:uncharacterized protein